jgi:AcrR family transcriptional regulator
VTQSAKDLRKQREAEQRRKGIIKVVRKLIRKGGLGEISLRKVAELAGYSTTVVYSLFQDKATLISQAMGEDLLELTGTMRAASEAHDAPLDRLRAVARAYVAFGLQHPDEYAFVFMQKRPHAATEAAQVQHGDPAEDPYAFSRGLFAQWAATCEVSSDAVDIDLMTQIYWEGIHGFTARQLVMGPADPWFPQVPVERHLDALIEVLLTGLSRQFARPR